MRFEIAVMDGFHIREAEGARRLIGVAEQIQALAVEVLSCTDVLTFAGDLVAVWGLRLNERFTVGGRTLTRLGLGGRFWPEEAFLPATLRQEGRRIYLEDAKQRELRRVSCLDLGPQRIGYKPLKVAQREWMYR